MTPYTLTPQRGEVLLRFTASASAVLMDLQRGSALAKSLGARYAERYIGYYMTPSAARKFAAPFDAGYSAYRSGPDQVWRYGRDDAECRRLRDAVKAARESVPI